MTPLRIVAAGDAMLLAEFEERIEPRVNARVTALAAALLERPLPGIRDVVPTFRSVAVYFDPLQTDLERLAAHIHEAASAGADRPVQPAVAPVEIPVCYDTEFGPDLDDVARFAGLRVEEVVAAHTAVEYRVYMLGFLPGFAYLGIVPPRIAAPRRTSPRLQVPAGAVGIAGQQTGIYPVQTPGGWNIIGRTAMAMVSFDTQPPARLQAGDTVRFRAIPRAEFERMARPSS